jgi:phenylalanyl-tRNA synthetase alpha chain
MKEEIEKYLQQVSDFSSVNAEEIDQFRIRFLGKKGIIPGLFEAFRTVPPEEKRELGQWINRLKEAAQARVEQLKQDAAAGTETETGTPDLTLPADFMPLGARHPVSIVLNQITSIFSKIGFTISEGPEIEDDWHNFTALNFPEEHPARDMQDTFFIDEYPPVSLRTHTSSIQIRVMEQTKPPIRTLLPGRVYRNEAISARAHCFFHQVEGLYVDREVSFADLKQTLYYFAGEMFGQNTAIRFRPSYFPFTEPSAEMDIHCNICGGTGCNICKYTGWVEILGCGMVDPNVLDNCHISSKDYTGFAFGMGIERIAILKYQIKDIRLFFENDLRFLKQFSTAL